MRQLSQLPTSRLVVAGILLLVFPLGCGGKQDGPPRYGLDGKVTLDGVPVLSGMLTLSPDSRKGNSGPGTMIPIGDGEYEVGADRGIVGGPHIVQFSIYRVGKVTGEKVDDDDDDEEMERVVIAPLKGYHFRSRLHCDHHHHRHHHH